MADSLKSLEMVSASQGLARSVHINPSHTLLLLLLLLATKILTNAETLFLKKSPPLKSPSEMEVAPRYKLLTLFTLCKQLWSKKFILHICIVLCASEQNVGWMVDG